MRELILSDAGVTLTDTYTAGGEVLMGALRWEKERADRVATEVNEVAGKLKRALADGIFTTPTLVKLAPLPLRTIVGTLSQTQTLLQALELEIVVP